METVSEALNMLLARSITARYKLSTVSIMSTEVAKVATELLLQRIQEQKSGLYERVQFEPRLIVIESSVEKTQTTQKL